jgi:prepilin-type N-terminal cleavage/methylation domain-containing protein
MKLHRHRQAGFTLIEVIAVLILTALAFVFAAMLLVTSTQVFISNKDAADDSQKIQVAMNRLVKELTFARFGSVSIADSGTVSWTSAHPDRLGDSLTATWNGTSGTNLTLVGVAPLLDNVDAFIITEPTAGAISITIRSSRSTGVTHSTIVHPRYEL